MDKSSPYQAKYGLWLEELITDTPANEKLLSAVRPRSDQLNSPSCRCAAAQRGKEIKLSLGELQGKRGSTSTALTPSPEPIIAETLFMSRSRQPEAKRTTPRSCKASRGAAQLYSTSSN
ncbi:hypothetical protein EYF80_032780 [Liparis tanakae]|uniref:Uncharacterized protein n=1 Tax=Liparis tanakae TaxID=230148 RepID=A0A4Z2GUP9_9TELE|nr:hypothetical protein EYF80_032780 [Liparis tanakae]